MSEVYQEIQGEDRLLAIIRIEKRGKKVSYKITTPEGKKEGR